MDYFYSPLRWISHCDDVFRKWVPCQRVPVFQHWACPTKLCMTGHSPPCRMTGWFRHQATSSMRRPASALYASQVDTVLELCLHIYVPTDSLSNCLGEWGRVGVYAIPVNEFLLIQYYNYVFIIFEVLMYKFLLISQSAVCSPLSVRYGAV